VKLVEGVKDVKVELVFDPPWDKDMISEAALLELGLL
jgi:metal-sulfur cluster biosynthetic enzyme